MKDPVVWRIIYNIVIMVCFTFLAIYFDAWWVVFFTILFTD